MTRRLGLRARITLWYLAVLCGALAIYAGGVLIVLHRHVFVAMDRELEMELGLAVERIELDPADGQLRWRQAAQPHVTGAGVDAGRWVEVWSEDGHLLLSSTADRLAFLGPPLRAAAALGQPQTTASARGPLRTLTRTARIGGRSVLVRATMSEIPGRRQLGELLFWLGLLFPTVAAIAAAGGFGVARYALAPVRRMAERAQQLSAERLGERLPSEAADEDLGQLGRAFNDTLARLEASFDRMRRFTLDASHELRTPLTAMRSVGEVGVQRGRTVSELRDVIGSMLEEADRLTRLVNALLQLSRAEAGDLVLSPEWIPACELVCDVATLLCVLAEERGQTLALDAGIHACVYVDRTVLRQALINLVDNAIKYSPEGSTVTLSAQRADDGVTFAVEDGGPGIPQEHRQRIFDRFYRVDAGRSRDQGGLGLGLALVKWAATVHDGRAEVESRDGTGSRFSVFIPALRCRSLEDCGRVPEDCLGKRLLARAESESA